MQAEFQAKFGGLLEWNRAAPNQPVEDHAWFTLKLAEQETLAARKEAQLEVLS